MAYFPNGTSSLMFQEGQCFHCHHWDDEKGCPVFDAHLFHNYDQFENEALKAVFDMLIPSEGEKANDCQMFLALDPDRCRATPDMFTVP